MLHSILSVFTPLANAPGVAGVLSKPSAHVVMLAIAALFFLAAFAAMFLIDRRRRARLDRERVRLNVLARLDPLTGIPNRGALKSAIAETLARASAGDRFAMFVLDLDNLKQINDVNGHQAGDDALIRIAAAIRDTFDESALIGRLGGDEFMAFQQVNAAKSSPATIAAALLAATQFFINDVAVSTSIGVSLTNGKETTFDTLYREADGALYAAKTQGKNRFCIAHATEGESIVPRDVVSVQLQTLVEAINGGIVIAEVGDDISIRYVSNGFFRHQINGKPLSGKEKDDLLQRIAPDDRPAVFAAARRAAATGEVCECDYRTNDEPPCWRHIRIARVSEQEEGVDAVVGVITDMTRIKRSEERYRNAEERYRIAVRQTNAQIWEVELATRTLRIMSVDAKTPDESEATYTDVPESLIRHGRIAEDSQDELRRMFADLFAGVEGREYLYETRVSGEETGWVKARFGYVHDENGQRTCAIGLSELMPNVGVEMRAFNEEHRFLEMIRPSLLGALEANLTKDTLTLCAGLTSGTPPERYSELFSLLTGYTATPEDLDALTACASIPALMQNYHKGNTWQIAEIRRRTSAGEICWANIVLRLLRHPVSGDVILFGYVRDIESVKRWELSLDCPAERDALTFLYTSETLSNLFLTAVRHMDADKLCALVVFELGGMARLKAERGLPAAQKTLTTLARLCRITIAGEVAIGYIDETHLAVFRADVPSADAERDAVVYSQEHLLSMLRQSLSTHEIDLYCGYCVSPASEAGFDEMLRRALVACNAAKQAGVAHTAAYVPPEASAPALMESAASTRKPAVLVVDDDAISLALLERILSSRCNVSCVSGGACALEALQARAYDLVICDLIMPEMSGWDVLERVSADKRLSSIPIVIVTADSSPESEIKALNLGATDVIRKPYVPEILLSRVRNIISARENARVAEQNRLYELRFQQQSRSLWLAEHDELTGLYSRQAFYRRVRERLDDERATKWMLLRWDLDDFKVFNDALGTQSGDRILRDIGALLRERTDAHSIVGRIEADHFVHLLPAKSYTPESVYERLSRWLSSLPVEFRLVCRLGVYEIDDTSVDPSIMCDRALLALRSTKGSFSQHIGYYDESMRQKLLEEQALANDMTAALEGEQFEVWFQPQYNYETGEMIGAEALARWNHPTRGMISPGVFIPLFERNGFVSKLDEYIWEKSCAYMRRWMDEDGKSIPVSVSINISRIDLYDARLCDKLCALIHKYGLPFSSLRLEITESAYMQNPEQLVGVVKRLQKLGFLVEMDDFGSGYSSLNTLKDVPVNILKLDVHFLTKGEDDSRGGNILSSVLRMAHWLRIPVIAEGVETRAQAEYLKSLSCEYMQGYFFSRPMSAEAFRKHLCASQIGTTRRYEDSDMGGMAEFWDPSAQNALLFSSFVGGAAIVEYRGGSVEVVRANDRFYHELETDRAQFLQRPVDLVEHFDEENRHAFLRMLDDALSTHDETDCEVVIHFDEKTVWTHTRARMLARNADSTLVYVSVENITARKQLEQQTRRQERALHEALLTSRAEEERDRLVLKYLNSLIFYYDYDRDLLSYQVELPDKGATMRTIENYMAYLPNSVVVHPDYIAAYREQFIRAKEAPISATFEYVADNFGTGFRWCRGHYASVADEKGHVFRLVGVVYDIQEEKDRHGLIESLSARLSEKNAVSDESGSVIERVFRFLYDARDTDTAIQSTLVALGEYYQVSRAYIFEDSEDHAYCSNTFEWCAPGITPQKDLLTHISYKDDIGSTGDALYGESGVLFCPDITLLPKQQYDMLHAQDIRATLQCGIRNNGVYNGFIGFDDCESNRVWTNEQVTTLSLMSKLLGSFVMLSRTTKKAALTDEFRSALDNNTAFVYLIDPETHRITYENGAIQAYNGRSHTGMYCYEAFLGLDAPCPVCPVHAVDENGKPCAVEILRPDGLRIMTQSSPIRIDGRDMFMITCLGIPMNRK